ncbi:hypothetical protein F4780DRAFT_297814 [Xylariomycetidae sp. FL0641]|nr:hypothetical protein F4780DRAFT_297814 [Xylariomycetidae sp. FL0641]
MSSRGRGIVNFLRRSGHRPIGIVRKSDAGRFNNTSWELPGVDAGALLGQLVTELTLDDFPKGLQPLKDVKITNCKYAASYSLGEVTEPTIFVPGEPAAWRPPALPSRLPLDLGQHYRDQNGVRYPDHPLTPAVQSLFTLDPSLDPSTVDFLGCASTLSDILAFCRSLDATFHFDVELIGSTVFFVRNHKDQTISDAHGYGQSFLNRFTTYGEDESRTRSHQRIVSYHLGGLRCLVRFECDGNLDIPEGNGNSKRLNVGFRGSERIPSIPGHQSCKIIPQTAILRIMIRSTRRRALNYRDRHYLLPGLWLRQIPNLVVGYHDLGEFCEIRQRHVGKDLLNWESDLSWELNVFVSVLRRIIAEAKKAKDHKLRIYRESSGPLQIREQAGEQRSALSSQWELRWAGGT